MINVRFGHDFSDMHMSGHAGYAESGSDVVCAAVSSAAMLTANLITDYFGCDAEVNAGENSFSVVLNDSSETGRLLLKAFRDHLSIITAEYPGTVSIKC